MVATFTRIIEYVFKGINILESDDATVGVSVEIWLDIIDNREMKLY